MRLTSDNELREILRKSAMLGVVFGQAGSSANIFTILGVSP
ncbi:three component ABC system middle component [Pantoea agglomerans]